MDSSGTQSVSPQESHYIRSASFFQLLPVCMCWAACTHGVMSVSEGKRDKLPTCPKAEPMYPCIWLFPSFSLALQFLCLCSFFLPFCVQF